MRCRDRHLELLHELVNLYVKVSANTRVVRERGPNVRVMFERSLSEPECAGQVAQQGHGLFRRPKWPQANSARSQGSC